MSITKVGSSYNFIYNTKTGKLSTKDGSKKMNLLIFAMEM